jgi:translation elongation factor P/translation initiation factor 5A
MGKRGKGGGFIKTKLKNILTSLTFEKTFSSDELIEDILVEKYKGQFSWIDNNNELIFLRTETFEEIRILKENVHNHGLLSPGEEYKVIKCEGKYIGVEFPNISSCTVISLENQTLRFVCLSYLC